MSKTALVTGGSRGIGAACAVELAEEGFSVYVNYHENRQAAERAADACGGTAVQADVSDNAAVLRMLERTGDIDTLVCCAGAAHYGLFTDTTDEQCNRILGVNLGGVITCCRAVIPAMVRARTGCIITLSSIWGITGASCEAVYSASKAAVIGLTKSLAKELGPSGIRVNCVAPGIVQTDMLAPLSNADLEALRNDTPLGILGRPEDIASVVRFLASDAAGFITGQIISPNGGFLI